MSITCGIATALRNIVIERLLLLGSCEKVAARRDAQRHYQRFSSSRVRRLTRVSTAQLEHIEFLVG